MFQKKSECDQYTVMIGLMTVSENLLGENINNLDLTLIKELLMNKVLNFNNHIKQICYWFDRTYPNEHKKTFAEKVNDYFSGKSSTELNLEKKKNIENENLLKETLNNENYEENKSEEEEGKSFENIKGYSENSRQANLVSRLKSLNRNHFFVYSASLSFNPKVRCGSDLLTPSNGGGVVFTITAKMPLDEKQRKLFLQLLLRYMGKNSVLLDVKSSGNSVDEILSNANVIPDQSQGDLSTILKPIPKYFDEDYSDEEKTTKEPDVANTYSFFRHTSYMLSKYASSKLVVRDDDKYVTQRLLQVKLQRGNRRGN